MMIFDRLESEVRSYSRAFPVVFDRAKGAELFDDTGRRYIDFFAGAGALNYGHNHPVLRESLLEYLSSDRIVHGLDMMTIAKRDFLETFDEVVLGPRRLPYKLQFTGPTGTNCVEAALKLARKVTNRSLVLSFTNGFHGMTLGALAVTGNRTKRAGAGIELTGGRSIPFDHYLGPEVDTLAELVRLLDDDSSGLEIPAAVIVETTQAEGGVNVASTAWLRQLANLCRRYGILLIVDDIQLGCGRGGSFFSFERAGITPDLVCLSKSLSGYGLPLALLLVRPELDAWSPGEHNGTFRGFNPAFVTGRRALTEFWTNTELAHGVRARGAAIEASLSRISASLPHVRTSCRGIGMIRGLALHHRFAKAISRRAFELGVIVETAGPRDEVLKLLPPLNIEMPLLVEGLAIIEHAVAQTVAQFEPLEGRMSE